MAQLMDKAKGFVAEKVAHALAELGGGPAGALAPPMKLLNLKIFLLKPNLDRNFRGI
jgi:hypothetical protein